MAIATFYRITESGKSALILLRKNAFSFEQVPVYVPAKPCEGMEQGDEFEIPEGYTIVPMLNEDGTNRTTKDGSANLMMLVW